MDFIEKRLLDCAVHIPKILIPDNPADHILWPSFPCAYKDMNKSLIDPLNIGNLMNSKDYSLDFLNDEKINNKNKYMKIYKNMKRSVRSGFLTEHTGFILTRHIHKSGIERFGLLVLLDYEKYKTDNSFIELSKKCDKNITDLYSDFLSKSVFDLPYAQALIEDENELLIEPLRASTFQFKPIFSFNHPIFGIYEGFLITTPQHFTLISNALTRIKSKSMQNTKPLFLVHEGVESFESGKIHWENLKRKYGSSLYQFNPSRFQLVELFNIFSPNLELNPCNILIKDISHDELITQFRTTDKIKVEILPSIRDMHDAIMKRFNKYGSICYGLVSDDVSYLVTFRTPESDMGIVNLQNIISKYTQDKSHMLSYHANISELLIEYSEGRNTAIIMPPINKQTFFTDIKKYGPLMQYAYCHDMPINRKFLFEARLLE